MASSVQLQVLDDVKEVKEIVLGLRTSESARVEREKNNEELLNSLRGNGKPGWKTIRDKVSMWEAQKNTITILIIGDILVRVFQAVNK